jgi:NAD(P)H dehydrogenase (quinone)
LIAITGATGALGRRVAARLAGAGVPQRLIVRDAATAPRFPLAEVAEATSYDNLREMTAALRGCETLLFVSARESAHRIEEHRRVVDAAIAGGVTRIVYTSFLNAKPDATFTLARDHYATERYIVASGLAYTLLQDSFYAELLPRMVSPGGIIAGPGGDGALAAVARDDVADVAALVLGSAEHSGRTYRLTGPAALTFAEIAAIIARVSGRTIRYKNETIEEAYASRGSYDAQKFQVDAWVSTYTAIAKGELAMCSRDVAVLLGRPAASLEDVLISCPESYAHIGTASG